MSIAMTVRSVDPTGLGWVEIEDADCKLWRYLQRRRANPEAFPHVEGDLSGLPVLRAVLIRDTDGIAILRQSAPGLPTTIVIDHAPSASQIPLKVAGGWRAKFEYEHVSTS